MTVAAGRIERFRTVMTGELFNLLKEHSILADLLQGEVAPAMRFSEGVRHGLVERRLPAELFSVRARRPARQGAARRMRRPSPAGC